MKKNKKIGILTFHKSYNYGAFMQCYSLVNHIKSNFPNTDVEVIDYTTQSIIKNYDLSTSNYLFGEFFVKEFSISVRFKKFGKKLSNLLFRPSIISKINARNKNFKEAWSYLPLSKHELVTDDFEKLHLSIKGEYDAVVVGSDAVWNWVVRGFPNAYFLNNDLESKKLSYAASSYGQDFSLVSAEQKKYLNDAWSSFDYIGVRDIPTANFVKSVNSQLEVNQNCDPTVLLDMNKIPVDLDSIKNKLIKLGINTDKPIIGIMASDWLGKKIKELFSPDYQIVAVYQPNSYADVYLHDLTPFEWSRVFSLFDITFTHFFHGTLLSLKNLTPVIPVEATSNYSSKFESKIYDILKKTDLLEYHFKKDHLDKNGWEDLKLKAVELIESTSIKNKIKSEMDKQALSFNGFKKALNHTLYNN
jgi:hypothetical protein